MGRSKTEVRKHIQKLIRNMHLESGNHSRDDENQCVMEAVSLVTNRMNHNKKNDHPQAACKSITDMMIHLNDQVSDDTRQVLKKLVPYVAWTNDGKSKERLKRILQMFMCFAASKTTDDESKAYKDIAQCVKNDNISKAIALISEDPYYGDDDDEDDGGPAYKGQYSYAVDALDALREVLKSYEDMDVELTSSNLGEWWEAQFGTEKDSISDFVEVMIEVLDKPLYRSKKLQNNIWEHYSNFVSKYGNIL